MISDIAAKIGIHARLLFAGFLLISLTCFTAGYMGVSIASDFLESRFKIQMEHLARYLAVNSELGLIIDQREMLKRLSDKVHEETGVVGVKIVNEEGEPVVAIGNTGGRYQHVSSPVQVKTMDASTFPYDVSAPPFATQKVRKIGHVELYFSYDETRKIIEIITMRFSAVSVFLALAAGLIFFVVSRTIVSPVTYLSKIAKEIASGEEDIRAKPGRLPETMELALAFNGMLDSIREKGEALHQANEEVFRQKQLAEMGKFSMMIAHEFKNPLGIIKSSMDILKKGDKFTKQEETVIYYIEDEIYRLNDLIESFLQFSKPPDPVLQTVDLNQETEFLMDRFELQYAHTDLVFTRQIPGSPCHVGVDPDLFSRALSNVLKNACEANGDKGIIIVNVINEGQVWAVEVRDQGNGISDVDSGDLFKPFYTTRAKGTGLGLAFVKHVIEAHKGSVSAMNIPGGALFRIELKADTSELAEKKRIKEESHG